MNPFPRTLLGLVALVCILSALNAHAALAPENVLVIYNDAGNTETSDGFQIWEHYKSAYGESLKSLNLNDSTLLPGRVTYADFIAKIRTPLRTHLDTNNWEQTVRVFLLTKGIPHQIEDINDGPIGTNASATQALRNEDNATLASVDSELTLLWHDLEMNEDDGALDSTGDNFVLNPYFEETTPIPVHFQIDNPNQIDFEQQDALDANDNVIFHYWSITDSPPRDEAGLIYLTARLDGDTLAQAKELVDRGTSILLDRDRYAIILDEAPSPDFDDDDFADAATLLNSTWENVTNDTGSDFLIGEVTNAIAAYPSCPLRPMRDPVALLSSYGANHSGGNHTNWVYTYQNQIPHGAIFNTYESFNGVEFGDITGGSAEHGQVADWVELGGTFGIGHVWEPFAFAIGRNETLADNFYNNGLTWVEAAWSSIQIISWQNTVVGDPLAKANFLGNVPSITLSASPDNSSELLEEDATTYTFTVTSNTPAVGDLDVTLSFSGATVGDDFTTSASSVTIPSGLTQASFTVTILDDNEEEGLEILDVRVAESPLDTNGDGFGEDYRFLANNSRIPIPIADTPFAWWQFDHFGERTSRSAEDDCDADDLINLWEFFLQSDPTAANGPGSFDVFDPLKPVMQGNILTFEIPKVIRSDTRLSLETTTTLEDISWSELVGKRGSNAWDVPSGTSLTIDTTPTEVDIVTLTTNEPVRGFRRFRVQTFPDP